MTVPTALPAPAGLTVSAANRGLIFLTVAADGVPAVELDALPGLPDGAVDELCAIALRLQQDLAAWSARHTRPRLEVAR